MAIADCGLGVAWRLLDSPGRGRRSTSPYPYPVSIWSILLVYSLVSSLWQLLWSRVSGLGLGLLATSGLL